MHAWIKKYSMHVILCVLTAYWQLLKREILYFVTFVFQLQFLWTFWILIYRWRNNQKSVLNREKAIFSRNVDTLDIAAVVLLRTDIRSGYLLLPMLLLLLTFYRKYWLFGPYWLLLYLILNSKNGKSGKTFIILAWYKNKFCTWNCFISCKCFYAYRIFTLLFDHICILVLA